jgi:hypothetical protein
LSLVLSAHGLEEAVGIALHGVLPYALGVFPRKPLCHELFHYMLAMGTHDQRRRVFDRGGAVLGGSLRD